jgi:hypothetical protein
MASVMITGSTGGLDLMAAGRRPCSLTVRT